MKNKIAFSLLFLSLISVFSYAQTVDEIVSKYVDAMGGKDKLAAVKTIKYTASVEIGPNMKAPVTMYVVIDKAARMEVELQGMKMIRTVEGDSGWVINPFGGKTDAERMSPEDVRGQKESYESAGPLYDYKAKGNTVEFLGKEDMEGTDTYKLKVTKKNGDIRYIYLDATSYLPLKETSKIKMGDKEVESESIPSNYKKVDGIMFPFSSEERQVGESQGQAINFDTVEINPKIDAGIFKMPPPAPAAPAATEPKK